MQKTSREEKKISISIPFLKKQGEGGRREKWEGVEGGGGGGGWLGSDASSYSRP